jgi:hypothetical protein
MTWRTTAEYYHDPAATGELASADSVRGRAGPDRQDPARARRGHPVLGTAGREGAYTDPGRAMVYPTGEVRQQFPLCVYALQSRDSRVPTMTR